MIEDGRAAGCAWGDGRAPSGEFELHDPGAADLLRSEVSELPESEDSPARRKRSKGRKPHRRGPIVACLLMIEGWPRQ